MTPSTMTRILGAAVATALLTWWLGWWAVVPVALVAGALPPRLRMGAGAMALAGAIGWGALLGIQVTHPSFGALLARVAGVFQLPGALLILVTLLYAMLLAWSAAVVGGWIATLVERPAPVTPTFAEASPRYESADRVATATVDSTAS